MGPRQVAQGALFYEFSIEDHVPPDHPLRAMDRFVDLGDMRRHLARFYSAICRPSVDPDQLDQAAQLHAWTVKLLLYRLKVIDQRKDSALSDMYCVCQIYAAVLKRISYKVIPPNGHFGVTMTAFLHAIYYVAIDIGEWKRTASAFRQLRKVGRWYPKQLGDFAVALATSSMAQRAVRIEGGSSNDHCGVFRLCRARAN